MIKKNKMQLCTTVKNEFCIGCGAQGRERSVYVGKTEETAWGAS